jgi:hypothetical protein
MSRSEKTIPIERDYLARRLKESRQVARRATEQFETLLAACGCNTLAEAIVWIDEHRMIRDMSHLEGA